MTDRHFDEVSETEINRRADDAASAIGETVLGDLVAWLALKYPRLKLRNASEWTTEHLSLILETVHRESNRVGTVLHGFNQRTVRRAIDEALNSALVDNGAGARLTYLVRVEEVANELGGMGSQAPIFQLLESERVGDSGASLPAMQGGQERSPLSKSIDGVTAINCILERIQLVDAAADLRVLATPYVWIIARNAGKRLSKTIVRDPHVARTDDQLPLDAPSDMAPTVWPVESGSLDGEPVEPTRDDSESTCTAHDQALLSWLALRHPEAHLYVLQLADGLSRDEIVAERQRVRGELPAQARQNVEQLVSRWVKPLVRTFERRWIAAVDAEEEAVWCVRTGHTIGIDVVSALQMAALMGIEWAHTFLVDLLQDDQPLDPLVTPELREWLLLTLHETPCVADVSPGSYAPAIDHVAEMVARYLDSGTAEGAALVLDLHDRLASLHKQFGLPPEIKRQALRRWQQALRHPLPRPTGSHSDLCDVLVLPRYRRDHLANATLRARAWHPLATLCILMKEAHLVLPYERARDNETDPVPTPVRLLGEDMWKWTDAKRAELKLGSSGAVLLRVARTTNFEPVPVASWLEWESVLRYAGVSSRVWCGVSKNDGLVRALALLPAANGGVDG